MELSILQHAKDNKPGRIALENIARQMGEHPLTTRLPARLRGHLFRGLYAL